MILGAVANRLKADSLLVGLLATYDFGSGPEPAIFTIDPIPEDAALPAIVITEIGGTNFETRDTYGAEVTLDVRAYDEKTRSRAAVEQIAWRIQHVLHHTPLIISGCEEVGCYAEVPQHMADDRGFPGYRVQVMVRFLET